MSKERHDCFVGNVSFDTTDEHLRKLFSSVGKVTGIRMVTDKETGRPRGFCFVEFEDDQTALSAIRNLNGQELNGRKLRVGYTNNSGKSAETETERDISGGSNMTGDNYTSHLQLHEAYDILHGMKNIVDEDRGYRAKEILEMHPQLIIALNEILGRLGLPGGLPGR
jgi:RNA recognition motif-containing protein